MQPFQTERAINEPTACQPADEIAFVVRLSNDDDASTSTSTCSPTHFSAYPPPIPINSPPPSLPRPTPHQTSVQTSVQAAATLCPPIPSRVLCQPYPSKKSTLYSRTVVAGTFLPLPLSSDFRLLPGSPNPPSPFAESLGAVHHPSYRRIKQTHRTPCGRRKIIHKVISLLACHVHALAYLFFLLRILGLY